MKTDAAQLVQDLLQGRTKDELSLLAEVLQSDLAEDFLNNVAAEEPDAFAAVADLFSSMTRVLEEVTSL